MGIRRVGARRGKAAKQKYSGRGKEHSMTTRFAALAFVALLFVAGGCSKSGQSSSAVSSMPAASSSDSGAAQSGSFPGVSSSDAAGIRAAIENRLQGKQGLNMGAMQMVIDSIAINGDHAQAHASFHVKNGGATGMTMTYLLERSSNGWVVTSGQPADGNTTLPPSVAHPGANSGQASQGTLPNVNAFFKNHPTPKSN
jgi:hypothetical protein